MPQMGCCDGKASELEKSVKTLLGIGDGWVARCSSFRT